MKIVCWNLNGIRSITASGRNQAGRIPTLSLPQFFTQHNADIYCFQETKVSSYNDVPPSLTSIPGYDSFWSFARTGTKGWSGVVTYARHGITQDAREDWGEGIAIDAEFAEEGRIMMTSHPPFILYNIYFPNARRGEYRLQYKLRFYAAFLKVCERWIEQGKQLIVVGDVNCAHHEIDIYDPVKFRKSTGFLPVEREWVTSFLRVGFIDAYRHLHPDKRNAFTFWRPLHRVSNQGWRIDYTLITKNLLPLLQSADILADVMGSDHCPIYITMSDEVKGEEWGTWETPKLATNLRSDSDQSKLTSFFSRKPKGSSRLEEDYDTDEEKRNFTITGKRKSDIEGADLVKKRRIGGKLEDDVGQTERHLLEAETDVSGSDDSQKS